MGKMAVIVVIGFLGILGLLMYNMQRSTVMATESSVTHFEKSTARIIAETGMHRGWRLLEDNDTVSVSNASLLNGRYSVSMNQIATDTVRVMSSASFGRATDTVTAVFFKTIKPVPDVPGAVSLASDTVDVSINGTPHRYAVDGRDYDMNGNLVGVGKPGIICHSSYDSVQSAAYVGQITGNPSPVSIQSDIPQPTSFINDLIGNADYTFTGDIPGGNFGTRDHPAIVYCDGTGSTVTLNGNNVIYGIVIIKGNVKITGTFKFYGLMIAYNDVVSISVDAAGTADMYGGMIMAGGAHSSFSMQGTATFYYSSASLSNVRKIQRLRLYALQHWYE